MINWQFIHQLLDHLDTAANSSSFWIELGIPRGEFDLSTTLLAHLKSGSFHFQMVQADFTTGWGHYSETLWERTTEKEGVLQKPGNTWNGNENLTCESISFKTVEELLADLLAGTKQHFSRSSLGTPLDQAKAEEMSKGLTEMLKNNDAQVTAFRLQTDFLHTVDEYESSGYIKLPYFETMGRDLAFAFKVEDSLYLLLTNGYS